MNVSDKRLVTEWKKASGAVVGRVCRLVDDRRLGGTRQARRPVSFSNPKPTPVSSPAVFDKPAQISFRFFLSARQPSLRRTSNLFYLAKPLKPEQSIGSTYSKIVERKMKQTCILKL